MPGSNGLALWVFAGAAFQCHRAAGPECACGGFSLKNGRLALDHIKLGRTRPLQARHGLEQAAGVGVGRTLEQLSDRCHLHDLAAVHHHGAVGNARHYAQIVGDVHDRHAQLVSQFAHQLQDLCLDGHVQRGGGLVGNQHLGVAGQGDGNHHALAHAPGKLVRIVLEAALGIGDAHQLQQLLGALAGSRLVHVHMLAQRLHDLVAHAEHRVQRGHGILKDEADLGTANGAQLRRCAAQQVQAFKLNRVRANQGRRAG